MTTHHTGCVCWEQGRDAKLAEAESRATRAEQLADALAPFAGDVPDRQHTSACSRGYFHDPNFRGCICGADEYNRRRYEALAQHAAARRGTQSG